MKNIKNNIEEFFRTSGEKVQGFIAENKKFILIAVCSTIAVLIITVVLILVFSNNGKADSEKNPPALSEIGDLPLTGNSPNFKIDPAVFWLLDEPLKLPTIQFSREQRKIWDASELEFWYEPPSAEAMENLHKKNKKIIDNILEAAP